MSAWWRDRAELVRLFLGAGWRARAVLVMSLLVAVVPSVTALVTGWLVSRVARAVDRHEAALAQVALPLIVLGVILVAGQLVAGVCRAVVEDVARRIDGQARERVRRACLAPATIDHADRPDFVADMLRASDLTPFQGRVRSPGTAAVGQVSLLFTGISAIASALVLARYAAWLAIGVVAGTWATRVITRRQWMRLAEVIDEGLPAKRGVEYWSRLISEAADAKEVRLFDLGGWVAGRRRAADLGWKHPVWVERRRLLSHQWITIGTAGLTALFALAVLGWAGLHGRIGPGPLVTYLGAAFAIARLGQMDYETYDVVHGLGAVHALRRLEQAAAPAAVPIHSAELDRSGPPALAIEGLRFSYGPGQREVLRGLSLSVPPRAVLAIVGANGIGKTTFIKLLAGLHEPTGGTISAGGLRLGEQLSVSEWRRRMTVVFQDFVRYGLSVRDNIWISAPEAAPNDEEVAQALIDAGGARLLDRLPDGLDTVLWRGGSGSVDLSGGQWQQLAIARALFAVAHGRDIVVLDEPTAHLDVRAEAEFYERVVGSVSDATVILISHRLSTIRAADRIALFADGVVAEHGSHDELMAANGRYAELFRLQASRFSLEGIG